MSRAEPWPLTQIEGRFYRAIKPDALDFVLESSLPGSAGRYHRPGQRTLYVTREADWAIIAVARYMAEDGCPRLVVPLRLSKATVMDQRDDECCTALGIDPADSAIRWQAMLAEGRDPLSWRNSDIARNANADGIIDPSRGIVDGWHLALFRWNEPGGPRLEIDGEPIEIDYASARSRWRAPIGWNEANGDVSY